MYKLAAPVVLKTFVFVKMFSENVFNSHGNYVQVLFKQLSNQLQRIYTCMILHCTHIGPVCKMDELFSCGCHLLARCRNSFSSDSHGALWVFSSCRVYIGSVFGTPFR